MTRRVQMYSVWDQGTESFLRPFTATADGEATRLFKDICNTPDHPMARHPEHYTLYNIGEFDEINGVFHDKPNQVLLTAIAAIDTNEATQ